MMGKFDLRSGLARNILTLFTGSTLAQAIPVLISPLLTRMYLVEDFAVLTMVTTLISLTGVIVTGRYEIAIGLPADDSRARSLVSLSMTVSVMTAVLLLLLVAFGGSWIAGKLNAPDAAIYLYLVPVAVVCYGWYQGVTYWNIRKRFYADLAASRVAQSLVNSGISLGYILTGLPGNGLVFGNVAGHFSAWAFSWFRLKKKHGLKFEAGERAPAALRTAAAQYADLPKVNGVHALTDMAQTSMVVFIISTCFGQISTGLYGLTMRVLQAPLNVIGSSFTAVFYKEVAEKYSRQERIVKLLRTTLGTLSLISFPVFLVLFITGPSLFAWIFGEPWREAGLYARILCPWLFLNFIASPVSHLPIILNRQRQFFLFSVTGNLAVILALLAGSQFAGGIRNTLILVATVQSVFQACMIYYFITIARQAEQSYPQRES